jgi:Flp pilus assembly protein CpaB
VTASTTDASFGTRTVGLRVAPRRTRARANGRAVAGGFVVALAVVLVFGAYLETRPGRGTPWVVAAAPLAAGAALSPADLTTTSLRLTGALAADAFASPAALSGRTLAVPLSAGELVTPAELTPVGAQPALRPVTVNVAGTDVDGLGPGARVDLLVTSGSSSATHTTILLRGADLIQVSSPSGGLLSAGSNGTAVVTLGVQTLAEVQSVVAAEHAGIVDLVTAERSDGTGPGPG